MEESDEKDEKDFEEDYDEYEGSDDDGLDELRDRIDQLEGGNSAGFTSIVYGFGAALAITISWSEQHSLLWAILHGLLSWLYVIYFAFRR